LRTSVGNTESKYDKEKLQERLAKLSGGVAVIRVGASTETAMKEKKHRYEDAISATRAAIEEGIVPGGAVTLLRASVALDKLKGANDDEQVGIGIVQRALEAPVRQIATNAGYKGDLVVEKVRGLSDNFGLDASNGEYVDLIKAGIIDPVKVTRSTIENAASIAGLVLTTEAIVVEKPNQKETDSLEM
jgi:chaperonin GroEL